MANFAEILRKHLPGRGKDFRDSGDNNHPIGMITKRYQLINNVGGWLVFAIALVTYWLTLEPTASYWDCGEFIIQADKLEVGHPPGNPIFMLTARFFANFAPDAASVSVMVNAMSGLLSALTILLLFWTITHLVRRLVVKDGETSELSLQQYLAIMGSGLVGSLAYCWSDTFWFSAVEGEVYAFSSFCTALVFWLILKWENRADDPHSDRYLILIAYIVGVSVAVHLLNLLCIPAIVLVFAYRKYKDMNLVKSLIALAISFVIIFFVLYGLVPGFIKVAQQFELFFVNSCHMSFNSGALIYAIVAAGLFAWSLSELWKERSATMIKVSFILAVAVSGMLFIGSSVWIGLILLVALAVWLFSKWSRPLPVRVLNIVMWSISVIFVGYSSYALILIRSSADTPMNQNSPDNVFDLAAYLNREQYGENPLLYGETLYSSPMKELQGMRRDTVMYAEDGSPILLATPSYTTVIRPGKSLYAKGVPGAVPRSEYNFLNEDEQASNAALSERGGDFYVKRDHKPEAKMNPELDMLFPRIYSRQHRDYYNEWVRLDTTPGQLVTVNAIDPYSGEKIPEVDMNGQPVPNYATGTFYYPEKRVFKPSFSQNMAYFLNYQLNHMYFRYFMWNFAGRQNDINNQRGELDAGNWISGIPVIDDTRLGDQSLLPDDLGKNNKGHNVYYMLPLILGIIGLLWQAFAGKRGIEQFWVVFFLFFMTGIAIVLYLNQPPAQPRERDYAFAGSFYAFAIWIGMGVAGLWRILMAGVAPRILKGKDAKLVSDEEAASRDSLSDEEEIQPSAITEEPRRLWKVSQYCAAVACLIGIVVPLQMVSQTWDDHDRSGRYAARDYAKNYLNSLEPNAIVFCNGDNDTFPLWYAQEVEGVRPDVKIINLSYLNSDWYANQQRMQSYNAAPVKFTATPKDYAYGRSDVVILGDEQAPIDLMKAIKMVYEGYGRDITGYPMIPSSVVTIPVNKDQVIKRGLVSGADTERIVDSITVDLRNTESYRSKGYISLGELLMLDIIATNAANGWERPIYWASTVGPEYHLGLTPYLRSTGMTHQLTPTQQSGLPARNDRAYEVVTKKYLWGGADAPADKAPYFDETARRMLVTTRSSILDVASEFVYEGDIEAEKNPAAAKAAYKKALETAELLPSRLPESTAPYSLSTALTLSEVYLQLGEKGRLDDSKITDKGLRLLESLMKRYAPYLRYNAMISRNFGNAAAMTTETTYIPYQYYRFIELYTEHGGKMQEVENILKPYGVSVNELRDNYNRVYGGGASADVASGMTEGEALGQFAEEVAKISEIANELAGLSPEEYAARSEEERVYDSILNSAIETYIEYGGSIADLEKYPNFKKLDRERTKRIGDEYVKKHPVR